MRTPNGLRAESIRTPNASRARALHATPLHSKNVPGMHALSPAGSRDQHLADANACDQETTC